MNYNTKLNALDMTLSQTFLFGIYLIIICNFIFYAHV